MITTVSFELVCVHLGKSFTDSSHNSEFGMPLYYSLINFPIYSLHVVSRLNIIISVK